MLSLTLSRARSQARRSCIVVVCVRARCVTCVPVICGTMLLTRFTKMRVVAGMRYLDFRKRSSIQASLFKTHAHPIRIAQLFVICIRAPRFSQLMIIVSSAALSAIVLTVTRLCLQPTMSPYYLPNSITLAPFFIASYKPHHRPGNIKAALHFRHGI